MTNFAEITPSVFAVDDALSDKSDPKNDGYLDFPAEKPSKAIQIEWCTIWRDTMHTKGYASLLRGKEPLASAEVTGPHRRASTVTSLTPSRIEGEKGTYG